MRCYLDEPRTDRVAVDAMLMHPANIDHRRSWQGRGY
jgi:hypothetical protein